MKFADLHIHTKFSDGTFTPQRVISEAKKNGLSCIAITDHDQVGAIAPAQEKARRLDIELIPGIELSAEADNLEVHILGYFIDYKANWFLKHLKMMHQVRKTRALSILEKLEAHGMKLNPDIVEEQAQIGAVGRLHIARMLQENKFVQTIQEAFDKYLGNSSSCYVRKFKLTSADAIAMIKKLKGVAVLAHPYCIGNDSLIGEFTKLGLRGLEVYYPEHNKKNTAHYKTLAKQHGLLMTGGSDCHGLSKSKMAIGSVKIEYELVAKLKEEAKGLQ